ncbi:tripartite tricarboxylate transporter permease [Aquibacillus sediminis]|uniref:tripartite tricarboxylate transporter permease n=1 Tax=Aquibacillus sediminis TaxID=2574734 RepID=UPI001109229C|nr:tripartite tricarboxylate transporter permease [Aquibacillus sediminis]
MELFWQLFEFHHLIVLFFGLLLGIIVGAMPGLTPTMGVALTIPFTFSMGPTEGLVILGGIYCGSVYGGSIPAILFNVPGAPASVATTFDGYPMTQKGEARKALEVSTIASVIGGLIGMSLLLFFAPIVADFSLRFGPSQSFWIAIFGLTVIAAISEGSIMKNLIGGCIGLSLAFIGIHTVTGTARFTFGMESLVGGLHVVSVLIGLFAFPQALKLIESLSSVKDRRPLLYKIKKSSIQSSFSDIVKKPKAITIGSAMGSFIGMIPGAGGNIASILSYNEVKRFSENKKDFGKGNKYGVIASESANNSMVGGSLIPLLTLGIPGSPTAAIFLGGLLIHGIWPGKTLFVDNAPVAYTFIYSMIAAQVLLLFLGLVLIKYFTKLTQIPAYIMAPVILSFSIIGAYTMQNNVFDIYTVVILGIFMFIMDKFKFAPAPIALGFILGPIAEEGLLHGLQVGASQGSIVSYFFTGGINIILYGLVIVTVLLSVFQALKDKRETKTPILKRVAISNFIKLQAVVYLVATIVCLTVIVWIQGSPLEHRIFPQITFGILALLTMMEWCKAMTSGTDERRQLVKKQTLPLIIFVSLISLLTNVIGFYSQVFLLMLAVPFYVVYVQKNTDIKLLKVIAVSICFTLFLYIVFSLIVKVPLPLTTLIF